VLRILMMMKLILLGSCVMVSALSMRAASEVSSPESIAAAQAADQGLASEAKMVAAGPSSSAFTNVPEGFSAEIIPIKYALASEIAGALNRMRTNGGFTAPVASGTGMISWRDRLQTVLSNEVTTGESQQFDPRKIVVDERSNSLLVLASRENMHRIKAIISKLDVVLAQILIEATVIEIPRKSSGIRQVQNEPSGRGNDFYGVRTTQNSRLLSVTNFVPTTTTATNGAGTQRSGFKYLASVRSDLLGGLRSLVFGRENRFHYVATFSNEISLTDLATNRQVKILQRPCTQTSDGVMATLFVGESRPYPSSTYYGPGPYPNSGYASLSDRWIDVTPFIQADGLIAMDIHQTIEKPAGTVTITNVGEVPIISRSEAQANVRVRDGDTIVVGGLTITVKNQGSSGGRFLQNIPLLGGLLRGSLISPASKGLIVLIRPRILPNPEAADVSAKSEEDSVSTQLKR